MQRCDTGGGDREADQARPLPRPRAGGPKGPGTPASTGIRRQGGEVKKRPERVSEEPTAAAGMAASPLRLLSSTQPRRVKCR